MFDILGVRIALEIGISGDLFNNVTDKDIAELEKIVKFGIMFENNRWKRLIGTILWNYLPIGLILCEN